MTWVFVEKDISGRNIHLSRERLTHMQKHRNMSNKLEELKETLRNPDIITGFEYDKNLRFYYKYYKKLKEYLFISVKYLNGGGFIITGFYVNKIK